MAVVQQSVQNRCRDHSITEYVGMPRNLTVESLRSGSLMRITRCMVRAFRSVPVVRVAGLG